MEGTAEQLESGAHDGVSSTHPQPTTYHRTTLRAELGEQGQNAAYDELHTPSASPHPGAAAAAQSETGREAERLEEALSGIPTNCRLTLSSNPVQSTKTRQFTDGTSTYLGIRE